MRLSTTTAIACAVVVLATAIGEASAGGRGGHGGGARSASHSGHPHHAHTTVFVGSSFFYGPAYYPAPYYYPAAPVYVGPPPPPPVYIEQGQDPATMTWYYCQSAHAYYPYVTECAEDWQQVVPDYDQQPAG